MLRSLWRAAFFWWRAARGHRLRPWRSPYLRWRLETYWGIPASEIGFSEFWRFMREHRRDLGRFLDWADRMR
jgi:hypothetical protein